MELLNARENRSSDNPAPDGDSPEPATPRTKKLAVSAELHPGAGELHELPHRTPAPGDLMTSDATRRRNSRALAHPSALPEAPDSADRATPPPIPGAPDDHRAAGSRRETCEHAATGLSDAPILASTANTPVAPAPNAANPERSAATTLARTAVEAPSLNAAVARAANVALAPAAKAALALAPDATVSPATTPSAFRDSPGPRPAFAALTDVIALLPTFSGPASTKMPTISRSPARRGLHSLARAVRAETRRADRDRRRAEALYPALLAMEPARRLDRIAHGPRFASPALARRLLAEAGAAARNRPAEARELADLALAVVARLEAERPGTVTVVALRAAAHATRAEALWSGGDSPGAEAALAAARTDLDATPVGEPEHALYCRVAALLRAGEGHIDETLALLGRAAHLYRAQDDVDQLALCLLERGWLLVSEDPHSALPPLRHALDLLGPDADPWTAVRARQGLALGLAELGRPLEAAPLQREARHLAQTLAAEPDRLTAAWNDAQIDARVGCARQAIEALPPLVERWLARGEAFPAALAALDLAELYVETDRWLALIELERLEPRLRSAGLPAEAALAFRAVVGLAHREPPSATYPLVHLRAWLGRARHRADLPYVPCRSAARTLPWDDLPLSSRREICRLAGVEPHTATLSAAAVGPDLRKLLAWTHLESTGDRIEWDGLDDARTALGRVVEQLRAAEAELRRIAARLPGLSEGEPEEDAARRRPLRPPPAPLPALVRPARLAEPQPSAPAPALPLLSQIPALSPALSPALQLDGAVLLSGAIDHTLAAHLAPAIADLADTAAGDPAGARQEVGR